MTVTKVHFLVHPGKDYTFRHYFATWGEPVADRVAVRAYPEIGVSGRGPAKKLERRLKALRSGKFSPRRASSGSAVVFTDLEILDSRSRQRVTATADEVGALEKVRRLNDPARSLTRFELLTALRRAGINSFAVTRATAEASPSRWPVYVRDDRSHDDGSMSELLADEDELTRHLQSVSDADLANHTIVEYAGAPDADGLFRKYAAFRVGDAIVPCHIFFGRHWVVKHSQVFDEATAGEELDYIETNPHQEVLRRAFDLARIEYGRADYGVVDGRVEIWEINTNPYVIRPQYTRQTARHPALAAFSRRFNAAIERLLA